MLWTAVVLGLFLSLSLVTLWSACAAAATPRPKVQRRPCLADPHCAMTLGFQWCTCYSPALTYARGLRDE